jgi:hypothetical protein
MCNPRSEYIGKYVCYDRADGGACWGRIKDVAIVNKIDGEKEVFILEHRYVRYWRNHDLKHFRTFYPNAAVGNFSNPIHGSKGKADDTNSIPGGQDEIFMEVKKVRGDSTLHLDQIDLERDIIDLDDVLGAVDDELLFKAVLNAKTDKAIDGKSALEIGLNALLKDASLSGEATKVLKKRLGIDI